MKRKPNAAIQENTEVFRRISLELQSRIKGQHAEEADELAEYTAELNDCVQKCSQGKDQNERRKWGIQAGVWMVEALIVLNDLRALDVEPALACAADEVLERLEEALRQDGALPPVLAES